MDEYELESQENAKYEAQTNKNTTNDELQSINTGRDLRIDWESVVDALILTLDANTCDVRESDGTPYFIGQTVPPNSKRCGEPALVSRGYMLSEEEEERVGSLIIGYVCERHMNICTK